VQQGKKKRADHAKTQDSPHKDRHVIPDQCLPRRQPATDEQKKSRINGLYPREDVPGAEAKLGGIRFNPPLFQARLRGPGRCISDYDALVGPDQKVDGLCIPSAILEQALAQRGGEAGHGRQDVPVLRPLRQQGDVSAYFFAECPVDRAINRRYCCETGNHGNAKCHDQIDQKGYLEWGSKTPNQISSPHFSGFHLSR
jgi:hypothetical protein